MAKKKQTVFTAGMLIDELSSLGRDTQIDFGGLEFYRIKKFMISAEAQIQFHQYVSKDETGKINLGYPHETNKPPTLKYNNGTLDKLQSEQ